jgi:hypothetical protein
MDAARSLRSSKPVGLLHLREQSLPVTCARAFRADPLRGPMREERGGPPAAAPATDTGLII